MPKGFLIRATLCVVLVSAQACTQYASWEATFARGEEAYQEGHYAEAEVSFLAALDEAERYGPLDQRLATSLKNLAEVYQAQGRYSEAAPLYRRALAMRKKALGPGHSDVA